MKKIILLLSFVFTVLLHVCELKAQGNFAQDVAGNPIKTSRYTDVSGSPYLIDTWEKALVQLNTGQTYNLEIKYDMIADNLFFKNKNGDSLNFVQPVKEFKISYIMNNKEQTHLYRSGFAPTVSKTSNASFYEVLYDGEPKLLKRTSKTLWEETTTYGTANVIKNINENTLYFTANGDKLTQLKLDKKAVENALSSKSVEIEKYIKDNKLDLKRDGDLIKVFTYFNSIK